MIAVILRIALSSRDYFCISAPQQACRSTPACRETTLGVPRNNFIRTYEQYSSLTQALGIFALSGVRRTFSWVLIQLHMVVICIKCALFVTSQFHVVFMISNQRFGEVC